MPKPSSQSARNAILRLCRKGLDAWTLRVEVLQALQSLVPFDCAWWATADPATLLFTGGLSQHIPEKATPLFLANELLEEDVNKFSALARHDSPVGTLYGATAGKPERSRRFRDILHPFGMGDELRLALREGSLCWGFICIHRTAGAPPFSAEGARELRQLAPQLAGGLRNALLLDPPPTRWASEAPAVVTLADDLSVRSMTANAEAWLAEMADWPPTPVPAQAVSGVAARLLAQERHGDDSLPTPRVRMRTRAGRWLTVHALRLSTGRPRGEIAVILEPARPEEMAPLLLSAYALTERERRIAQYVLRGMSNKAIGRVLSVSPLTVQQHLKSVFEKVGVHSRGELMGRVLLEYRGPAALSSSP